ncbi:hypothetical protein BD779DRAFT_1572028 [Infundibulicybe gibba]|nr:hypothetical protein BD779DRAFT_1572028 [Infundibulicybe gibba]
MHAQTVLDEDHYSLKDVKDRILEFLAVGKLRGMVHQQDRTLLERLELDTLVRSSYSIPLDYPASPRKTCPILGRRPENWLSWIN